MSKIVIIIFLTILGACSSELEYQSADAKHLNLIIQLLDKRNIPYKLEEGSIKYSSSVKTEIENVLQRVRKSNTLSFEDEAVREYLYSELNERNIEYLRSKNSLRGEVVFWPNSDSEVDEILKNTIEYRFEQDIKNGKFSD